MIQSEDIHIVMDNVRNYEIELMIGNCIAYKFPQYTHMINTRYNGGNELSIDFLDPDAKYQQEVADYVRNVLKSNTL